MATVEVGDRLTTAQHAEFEANGLVHLPGALAPDRVAALRAAAEALDHAYRSEPGVGPLRAWIRDRYGDEAVSP
jgi:hypothetical protein